MFINLRRFNGSCSRYNNKLLLQFIKKYKEDKITSEVIVREFIYFAKINNLQHDLINIRSVLSYYGKGPMDHISHDQIEKIEEIIRI